MFHLLKNTAVKTAPTITKSTFVDWYRVHEGGLCKCCREFIRRIKAVETNPKDLDADERMMNADFSDYVKNLCFQRESAS